MMKQSAILGESARLVWRHKWLGGAGLLLAMGAVVTTAVRWWLVDRWLPIILDASGGLPVDPLAVLIGLETRLFGWVAFLFVGFVIYWLVATMTEAGLIEGVLALRAKRPFTFTMFLHSGWHWLGPFIAIDTLLFLPWFVVTLAAMVVILVMLAGIALSAETIASGAELLTGVGLGLACLLPLLMLSGLIAAGTLLLRTVTLREAVLHRQGVKLAIRHTWQRVKRHWLALAILAALLWGVEYGVTIGLQLVEGGVWGVTAVLPQATWLSPVRLLAWLLVAFLTAGLKAWIATAWTLAWQDISAN